jgi:HNH endonuclease
MAGTWKAPPGWRKLRERVFQRYGHVCWRCGVYANTVDHVIPRVLGGSHDLDNLRPACSFHNYSTGASVGNRLRPVRPLTAAQRQAIGLKRKTAVYGTTSVQGRPWRSSRQW